MSNDFVKRVLRENRPLFTMVHGFNFHPALHIHPRRFDGHIPPAIVEFLSKSRRGERRLSRWANSHWQLPANPYWDFADPRRRLALLQPLQLESLLRYAGAAVHADVISRAIDRQTKSKFREALGEQAYHFAVKRAALLSRGIPESLRPRLETNDDLQTTLETTGYRCVLFCQSEIPPLLAQRLNLKLPADVTTEASKGATEEERERVWNLIKRILFTEVAPELKPCFN